ncbi:MAG: BamA/TamA family outer membrane protein [Paludibacter sp.]
MQKFFKYFFVSGMKLQKLVFYILIVLLFSACNTTKFVPDGEFLLDKYHIKTDSKVIQQDELKDYLRQTPNAAVFGVFRMQLGLYNFAGKDTSKWINKTLKRIGDPPVIYSPILTSVSIQQLQKFLENKGYIDAKVESKVTTKGKKATVDYNIKFNKPYRLNEYSTDLKNNELTEIATDTSRSLIQPDMLFDADVLNAERDRITTTFRQSGYYNFNKEFLTYLADSTLNSHKVNVKLEMHDFIKRATDSTYKVIFKQYTIRKVIYFINTDVNAGTEFGVNESLDTIEFNNFILITQKKHIINLDALVQNTYINPLSRYNDEAVQKTYQALNSLGPVKYVDISFKQSSDSLLDCNIVIIPGKTISVSTELEGTYTEGYWGGAANVNFANRNVFKGAETLSAQFRGAYEWQDNIWAQDLGVQLGLKFPKFMFPFGGYNLKRNMHANTEFTGSFNSQFRPGEFSTKSLGAGMKYSWNRKQFRHSFDLFNLSYVHFDTIYQAFRDSFLNKIPPRFNPYNYNDHFIMSIGYTGTYTNFNANRPLMDYSTMRYNVETAGNIVNLINHLSGSTPDNSGAYRLFGIRYSQYVKGEYNITHHQIFDKENRFVYHLGLGLGIPYGNADVIPYEKRFFSGGANSVRGWSESTLGPGVYQRIDNKRRDYNQVGDIKLDMNMEYRAKLFWVLEGALFLDAGNIWTIKDYDTQSGGTFRYDTFMKQIAIAYGVGFRFDFSFFIARLDFGVKLFDPVRSRLTQWRINPTWNDDVAVHLAIGYPF